MEDKTIQVGGGDSYISYDENTNEIIFNGANVVTTQPGIGDILCHDENRKYKFIRCDTYQGGIFPAAWETLGVVAMRKGNRVWVVAKENATKKFMDVYPYVVTGYELDGAEHTAQLRLHGKPTKSTFYDFKYTASSVDEFVSQLQQFLTANAETDWSAYKDAQGRVILQYNNYTLVEYYMTTITYATGLTLTGQVLIDCPQQPSWIRKCGNWGYGVWHAKRAKEYFKKDLTNTSFNPSSDLTGVPSYPICYPAFSGTSQYQSDHCLVLRERYCKDPAHPTEAEWEAYIDDITPVSPAMIGGFAPKWRGREMSDSIKDITYTATDGMQKPLYPGANYCSKFFDGKGYMLTSYEFYEMFKELTLGTSGVTNQTADAINRSLYAIGGETITTATSYLLCVRTMNLAIVAANGGNMDTIHFYGSRRCIPVLQLDLSK